MSIDRKPDEKKLSRAVLDLKFMKKSKEKREILDDAEERQQLYQDQLSMLHEGADRIVMLSSYFDCKKFLPCRLSFGGMDPDIEKLNEDKLTGLYKVIKVDLPPATGGAFTGMAADVDEEEMAESYLASNIRQKFGVKRKSEPDDYGFEEDNKEAALGNGDRKIFKAHRGSGRELFSANIGGGRGSFRGRGDSRGRGRGDSRGRGRGDSRGRGRGDSRGRGRGDSRGRGRGDSRGRGRGDSQGRGRGDFRGRGRGDFRGRGRGEFRGRGRDNFRGKGGSHGRNESQEDQGNTFNQDNNSDFIIDCYDEHSPKKMKFMKPDSD